MIFSFSVSFIFVKVLSWIVFVLGMFDNGSFYLFYLALDKNESSLMVLMKYHDQLVKISGKIPFTEADCAVKFTWKDPFTSNKGFMSSGSRLEFLEFKVRLMIHFF